MTEATFKLGDLVRLKSGGPLMTVVALASSLDDSCVCSWFDPEGHSQRDAWPPGMLVLVPEHLMPGTRTWYDPNNPNAQSSGPP